MRSAAILVFVSTLLLSTVAAAQDPSSSARADALFTEGTAALERGRFEEACAKLAESRKIDALALGTLVNLARCSEESGKTATAHAYYTELATRAAERNQADRVALARRHLASLEPKLSRVTIHGGDPVTLDGREVDRDKPLLVDPGVHTVEASAPGKVSWSKAFELKPGASTDLAVPALASVSSGTGPAPGAMPAPVPHDEPLVSRLHDGSPRRTIGFVVGGAGIVVLAVGVVAGARAMSSASSVNDACPRADACRSGELRGVQSDYDTGKTMATLSTIAIPLGAAALGAGILLVLTAPSSGRSVALAPRAAPGGGGVVVGGAF